MEISVPVYACHSVKEGMVVLMSVYEGISSGYQYQGTRV